MRVDQTRSDFDLRSLVRIVWRRKLSILLCILIVLAGTLAVSLQKTPTYSASAKILVTSQGSAVLNSVSNDAQRTLANEAALATSDQFHTLVVKQLGRQVNVSAKPSADSDVLILTANATSASRAAKNVNDYAKAFVDIRKGLVESGLDSQNKEIQSNIDSINQQLAQLAAQEQAIRDQITQAGSDTARVQTLQTQLQNLTQANQDQRQSLSNQLGSLRDRQNLIGLLAVTSGNGQPQSDVQILRLASKPSTPVSPNIPQNATIAIVIGLLIGLCVAYGREQLEDHVRGRLDLEADFPDIPVLAAIPYDRDSGKEIATADRGNSQVAESYRKLRTALEFLSINERIGVVQITSSAAGEGKTTIAVNLAAAVAQAGQNVVLLCADFRIPRAHTYFDLDNHTGLSDVLLGKRPLGEVVHKTKVDNLYIVPAGPVPTNPAELLDSDAAHRVVEVLSKRFDLVVLDCPARAAGGRPAHHRHHGRRHHHGGAVPAEPSPPAAPEHGDPRAGPGARRRPGAQQRERRGGPRLRLRLRLLRQGLRGDRRRRGGLGQRRLGQRAHQRGLAPGPPPLPADRPTQLARRGVHRSGPHRGRGGGRPRLAGRPVRSRPAPPSGAARRHQIGRGR